MVKLSARLQVRNKVSGLTHIDLEIYTDKIGESGRLVIRRAYEEARSKNHNELTAAHVLIAIAELEPKLFGDLMAGLGLNQTEFLDAMASQPIKTTQSAGVKISESLRLVLQKALMHAREKRRQRLIESIDLLVAAFEDERILTSTLLTTLGVDRKVLIDQLNLLSAGSTS